MSRRRRLLAPFACALLLGPALSACTLGQPVDFRHRTDDACQGVRRSIARLDPPRDGASALRFALDRYVAVERLVAQVTDDAGLPGGTTGAQLRMRWLRPARASLRSGRTDLATLRQAVRHGDRPAVDRALVTAVAAGTRGVDTGVLRERGLPGCAAVFTTPTTGLVG